MDDHQCVDKTASEPRRLSTRALFGRGGVRVHVNRPLHQGDTPLHDHDFYELAIVESGRAIHRDVNGTRAVTSGEFFWLPPGIWHSWEHCRDLRLVNICFAKELWQSELSWWQTDPDLAKLCLADGLRSGQLTEQGTILALTKQLRQACVDHAHTGSAVIGRLLCVLAECAPSMSDGTSYQHDDIVSAIMDDFIHQLAHDWSLQELAERHGLERSYLGRRFKKVVGQSPLAWLARRRCERAGVLLLTTPLSVAEIGKQVGWPQQNYFARIFRQEMGQSPSEYRKQLPMPATPANWIQW